MQSIPMAWLTASGTQTGTQHQQQKLPCQDHLYHREHNGTLAAALADGAGSAARGGEGARLAARTIVRSLLTQEPVSLDGTRAALTQAAEAARRSVQEKALSSREEIQEYHTTLLAVIHTGNILGTLQIGDGVIITASPGGDARMLHQPQQGRYPNETNFLTGKDFRSRMKVSAQEAQDTDRVFMTSDGMQRLVLDYPPGAEPIPHQEFFRRLFDWLESQKSHQDAGKEVLRLLQSPRVRDRTQDDTSILAAILRENR